MFAKVTIRIEPYPQGGAGAVVVAGAGRQLLPEHILQAVIDVLNEQGTAADCSASR